MAITAPNLYTRWSRTDDGRITADILGTFTRIQYDATTGVVTAVLADNADDVEPAAMDPDTARMVGVRLIEASTRAEAHRRVRDRDLREGDNRTAG